MMAKNDGQILENWQHFMEENVHRRYGGFPFEIEICDTPPAPHRYIYDLNISEKYLPYFRRWKCISCVNIRHLGKFSFFLQLRQFSQFCSEKRLNEKILKLHIKELVFCLFPACEKYIFKSLSWILTKLLSRVSLVEKYMKYFQLKVSVSNRFSTKLTFILYFNQIYFVSE